MKYSLWWACVAYLPMRRSPPTSAPPDSRLCSSIFPQRLQVPDCGGTLRRGAGENFESPTTDLECRPSLALEGARPANANSASCRQNNWIVLPYNMSSLLLYLRDVRFRFSRTGCKIRELSHRLHLTDKDASVRAPTLRPTTRIGVNGNSNGSKSHNASGTNSSST